MQTPSISSIKDWENHEVTKHIHEGISVVIEKCREAAESAIREGDKVEAVYWLGQKDALAAVLDASNQLSDEALEEERETLN